MADAKDTRTKRQKLQDMAARGTPAEQAAARRALARLPPDPPADPVGDSILAGLHEFFGISPIEQQAQRAEDAAKAAKREMHEAVEKYGRNSPQVTEAIHRLMEAEMLAGYAEERAANARGTTISPFPED